MACKKGGEREKGKEERKCREKMLVTLLSNFHLLLIFTAVDLVVLGKKRFNALLSLVWSKVHLNQLVESTTWPVKKGEEERKCS